MLGRCYYYGEGVTIDHVEAVKWFRKSAEKGDAEAQYMLGRCYDDGIGVNIDHVEAVEWYRKSAEQDHADAQQMLLILL